MRVNPIQAIDFYKAGHVFQYPKGTELVYSNFTARSDRLAKKTNMPSDGHIIFYGLQGFIKWFLIDAFNENFFKVPKEKVLREYNRRMDSALGAGSVPADHIAALHDLGYLPLVIRALPEGSLVPMKVPVLTIHNTLPDYFWLTNYIESVLSAELWKACTNATTAYKYREILEAYAHKTGAPLDFVLWQGHDFSFRGVGGVHDAMSNGSAHLTSFLGTDTVPAFDYLEDYYHGLDTFIGGSVPATEHSVMCMGGKDTELETYRRLITEVYPSGVVSIVSDTWDFWHVISETAKTLKPEILARGVNEVGLGKVVFRPDSGDPVEILCGVELHDLTDYKGEWADDEDAEEYARDEFRDQANDEGDQTMYFRRWDKDEQKFIFYKATGSFWANSYEGGYLELDDFSFDEIELSTSEKGAVEVLWDIFGGTETAEGYKVLHERVGLIYGDSITLERAQEIMRRLEQKGFASCNTVFGIGSYTYQYTTRDTYGFAIKSTAGSINGQDIEIFKDPKTDNGVKKSARGFLKVVHPEGDPLSSKFVLVDQLPHPPDADDGLLEIVFRNGVLLRDQTLVDIRTRINENLLTNSNTMV